MLVGFFFTHDDAGASSGRHSLRPLIFWGGNSKQNSRERRGEIAKPCLFCLKIESETRVSRTRCSVLHAAPQSRDPLVKQHGPRISSAPRRKRGALRSIRGT